MPNKNAPTNCLGCNPIFQPEMQAADLAEPALDTEDPAVVRNMTLLLQAWAQDRPDLPEEFSQRFTITEIRRQPVTWFVLTMQHVSRELQSVEHPHAGEPADTRRWPTQDLFDLLPIDPFVFPSVPETVVLPLAGQESIDSCRDCRGRGTTRCVACSASGEATCSACEGEQQLGCATCGGAGALVAPNGKVVECVDCRATGLVPCNRCRGKGTTHCGVCAGDGHLMCHRCQGNGEVKTSWIINEQVRTEESTDRFAPEMWALDRENLGPDCLPIQAIQWRTTGLATLDEGWKTDLPEDIVQAGQRVVDACHQQLQGNGARHDQQIVGVRLEIRGCFAYDVAWDCQGQAGGVYFAGARGRVIPNGMPVAPNWLQRCWHWCLRNFWSEPDIELRPRLSTDYLRLLRRGDIHAADVNGLIPAAIAALGATATLTGDGYRMSIPTRLRNSATYDVEMDVTFDLDDRHAPILCTDCALGEAHRDLFPDALAYNHRLAFGRIAVTDDSETGHRWWQLVDRRPYEFAEANGFAQVLSGIAHDAAALVNQRTLG